MLFHGSGESVALYRCPNKKIDGYAVYTNTMPSGAFRGYGLSQTNFAIESAMDEVARKLGIDPFAFRRLNVVRPRRCARRPTMRDRTTSNSAATGSTSVSTSSRRA